MNIDLDTTAFNTLQYGALLNGLSEQSQRVKIGQRTVLVQSVDGRKVGLDEEVFRALKAGKQPPYIEEVEEGNAILGSDGIAMFL